MPQIFSRAGREALAAARRAREDRLGAVDVEIGSLRDIGFPPAQASYSAVPEQMPAPAIERIVERVRAAAQS